MFFGHMNSGCGCGNNINHKDNDCCWIILLLLLCGNCNLNFGDNCCDIIVLLLLLSCCGCGNNHC